MVMLRASFPPVKCINGHVHSYTDNVCPLCHEGTNVNDETAFCPKCSMIRPTILDTTPTQITALDSRFCFWCGEIMTQVKEEALFNY